MLSMETCVSPDGSTVSYYHDGTKCSDLGLQRYHFIPEPFNHVWMWMHNYTLVFTILVLVVLPVGAYLLSHGKKSSDDKHRERHDHLV